MGNYYNKDFQNYLEIKYNKYNKYGNYYKLKILDEIKFNLIFYNKIIIKNYIIERLIMNYNKNFNKLEYLFKILYYIWYNNDKKLLIKCKKKYKNENGINILLNGVDINKNIDIHGSGICFYYKCFNYFKYIPNILKLNIGCIKFLLR